MKSRKPRYTGRVSGVRYGVMTAVPVRDFGRDGAPAVFEVCVYGATARDIALVGGDVGSRPLRKAVERLGLDPNRYQAALWDVPAG